MKECCRCHEVKDLSEFRKYSKSPDGHGYACRQCLSQADKIYNDTHHAERMASQHNWKVNHPEEVRQQRQRYQARYYVPSPRVRLTEEEKAERRRQYNAAHKEDRHQYYIENREKKLAYAKQWRAEHPEKVEEYRQRAKAIDPAIRREQCRKYKQKLRTERPEEYKARHSAIKHRRRARIKGNGGSYTPDEYKMCLEFFGGRCAYTGEPLVDGFHMDHVVPLAKGGTSAIHNLVPCNPEPNLDKSDRDFAEWYFSTDYYTRERYEKILGWIG